MDWDAEKRDWERSISRKKKRKFRWVGPRVSSMATAGHNYIVNELALYSLSCQGVYQSKTVSHNKYVSSLTIKTKQKNFQNINCICHGVGYTFSLYVGDKF